MSMKITMRLSPHTALPLPCPGSQQQRAEPSPKGSFQGDAGG